LVVQNMTRLILSDCLDALQAMPEASVDAVVTDPPYGLSFMGKRWDYDVPAASVWAECLRVLKPGGHLLAFAGTRTQHRMAVRIEDAGFDIRDMIAWVYGSGFPKSHNLDGAWDGWGTALKPALEPITLARKPFDGTVAGNVLKHGTGALNVQACRVGNDGGCRTDGLDARQESQPGAIGFYETSPKIDGLGRWPANFIHDGSQEVVRAFGAGPFTPEEEQPARFFYCAKAQKEDRDDGLGDFDDKTAGERTGRKEGSAGINPYAGGRVPARNVHPTVKPVDLMAYLCRLVTPPGGVVLDPFMGSGSTGKAAILEGFGFIGIERDADYFRIAEARIAEAKARPKQPRLL
jgi:DNA modification methylase